MQCQNVNGKYYQNILKALPDIKLVTIDDPQFGGWAKAQKTFFDDGGVFDRIYTKK